MVQGVGFRPFVYRIAQKHRIKGTVKNNNKGVEIYAAGEEEQLVNFIADIQMESPLVSKVMSVDTKEVKYKFLKDFTIIPSVSISNEITHISPDIAVCDSCLQDMQTQKHRINYPLINCTHCGPRFTILKNLPYDRGQTTMSGFEMCDNCQKEYHRIENRRFHAQPVSCNSCGPQYSLWKNDRAETEMSIILDVAKECIENGEIIAIKGTGGFHLVCDARNKNAVANLRRKKQRDGKPFAVMFSDIYAAEKYLELTQNDRQLLQSWKRPIVLCKAKRKVAPDVCNGLQKIGAMLPSMPFHHLLFKNIDQKVLVFTSGNISEEPIIIDNNKAKDSFQDIANAQIDYNRDIHNRTDDSVVFTHKFGTQIIRRARGYVPQTIILNKNVDGIFAAGAELSSCFAIGKSNEGILSQHIGDLKNLETLAFYEESFKLYQKLFRCRPALAVADLHPDYLSTKFANKLNIPFIQVQHHHAHIAAVMAEHQLDEKVIGVCLDGTGFGTDGNIWGSEFMIADYNDFNRISHFEYIPLPGGDVVTKEPWRVALAMMYLLRGKNLFLGEYTFLQNIEESKIQLVLQAIDKNINTPLSCGAGRLFDAVSALIGLCINSQFHAEAPLRLEDCADMSHNEVYSVENTEFISFLPMMKEIQQDLKQEKAQAYISTKFHNTLIDVIIKKVLSIYNETGINKVCLSGGCFQNKILLEGVISGLQSQNVYVYFNEQIPINDAGIAIGQLMLAAAKNNA